MQRLAQPADVAAACLYLASPEAAFVTGAHRGSRRRRAAAVSLCGVTRLKCRTVTIAPVARTDTPSKTRRAARSAPLRAVDGRVPGRRGLATRKRLVECTIDLLASSSYRDLKVTDITRAAGTSPATFYQYFVDLESVLLAVAEQAVEDGQQLVDLIVGPAVEWRGRRHQRGGAR